MAIIQVSRITHRKGLKEDLPQLTGAELGWAIDTRELFIGNGTLEEGAPIVGNTRILTEFDDLLNIAEFYTYKGEEAGYTVQTGPDANNDIERTLQNKLDDVVSIRDFGAVGDGVEDDTAAINRALFELYCRDDSSLVSDDTRYRRQLFFPAGVYRVTGTVLIPPYARLIGEGAECSIIRYEQQGALETVVARTTDSLQQTGVAIGNNGAQPPEQIEIESMSFHTTAENDIFLADSVDYLKLENVVLRGNTTTLDSASPNTSAFLFSGTFPGLVPAHVVLDHCAFYSCTYGVRSNMSTKSITVSNCDFEDLYSGVLLTSPSAMSEWPTGFRFVSNTFDQIYSVGIDLRNTRFNVSLGNVFYNVGSQLDSGLDTSAIFPVIFIQRSDNLSWGDMFERTTSASNVTPRIQFDADAVAIGVESSRLISLGKHVRETGKQVVVPPFQSVALDFDRNQGAAFVVDYTVVRGADLQRGTLTVAGFENNNQPNFVDDFVQSADLDFRFSASRTANQTQINAVNDSATSAFLNYSINYLL